MSTQLHIGEVAKLLGVSQKTIRHYHKVGLLAEPARTESGYRLYTPGDLLRLQRIRRLQSLGLSLKQIKTLLGEQVTEHERTLREVLQVLLMELSAEIQKLEEQRERISVLLAADTPPSIEQPLTPSPTIEYIKGQLGEQLVGVSPELWQLDEKIFGQLDAFHWPESYNEGFKAAVQYLAEHPAEYQQMLAMAERLAALAALPEDAPEVDKLIEEITGSGDMVAFLSEISELSTQFTLIANPFAEVFSEVMSKLAEGTLSPAQQRFLAALNAAQTDTAK